MSAPNPVLARTVSGRLPPGLVIVGRPNVGKSTLFNRLLGRRRALVHDEPGVTRDRMEERAEWWIDGRKALVRLVDTGGLGGDRFADDIQRQVRLALESATAVIVLFDGQTGLTPLDREVLIELRRSGVEAKGVPLIGAVNKVDEHMHESMISDFYETGLSPLVTVSAEHGRGIDELQAAVIEAFGDKAEWAEEAPEGEGEEAPAAPARPRIAIIGRPNAGKSTLVNALLGESRMITSPVAGTTVDAVDSVATLGGREYILIDTAGIRRKAKTEQGVEVLSVVQARKALERCEVAIVVVDGVDGVTDQDEKIAGLVEEAGRAVIVAINKWDASSKFAPGLSREAAAEQVRERMGFLKYAPVVFISGLRRQGLAELPDLIDDILEQRRLKIPTGELTEWVRKEANVHNPKNAKFYLCHQSGRNPPTFACHVSDPDKVHFSLKRHLANSMRSRWGYMGSPIRLVFLQRGKTGKSGARA